MLEEKKKIKLLVRKRKRVVDVVISKKRFRFNNMTKIFTTAEFRDKKKEILNMNIVFVS